MNKIPDSSDLIIQIFGKREGFPNQAGNPLPKRAIESLDMIGLAAFFSNRMMPAFREYTVVSRPKICIANGALLINNRQGIP